MLSPSLHHPPHRLRSRSRNRLLLLFPLPSTLSHLRPRLPRLRSFRLIRQTPVSALMTQARTLFLILIFHQPILPEERNTAGFSRLLIPEQCKLMTLPTEPEFQQPEPEPWPEQSILTDCIQM